MKLQLTHGYPYPYPVGLTEAEQHVLSNEAAGNVLVIEGVYGLQWLHTVTVEFDSSGALGRAQALTGWKSWSLGVLEAPQSIADGYDHPAIIANGMAYCGFMVLP